MLLFATPTNSDELRGYHTLGRRFPANFAHKNWLLNGPHLVPVARKDSVCPVPFSIASTSGISFDFFSCGY